MRGEGELRPVVVQDRRTGQVLMLAYADAEALRRTQQTGFAHFWSRSRKTLWQKGETSGHRLRVFQVLQDCDADSLLYVVEPEGPTCHTGEVSCFHRDLDGRPAVGPQGVLFELERVIAERKHSPPPRSYTAGLLAADPSRLHEKVFEEASEVVRAARQEGAERLVDEAADLVYHLSVLLVREGVGWAEVLDRLAARRSSR